MIDAINLHYRAPFGIYLGAAAVNDHAVFGLGIAAIDALAVKLDHAKPAC